MIALLAALSLSAVSAAGDSPVQRLFVTTNPSVRRCYKAVVDAMGNSYAIGDKYDSELILVKYSPTGTKLWQRNYSQTTVSAVGVGLDGNVVIAGATASSARLFKVSANGTLVWDKTSTLDQSGWRDMVIDAGGEISVTGSIPFGAESKVRTSHFRPDGVQTWQRDYTHPLYQDFEQTGLQIECDSSGNVYFMARCPSPTSQMTLGKYTRTGQLGWIKHPTEPVHTFTLFDDSKVASVTTTTNDNYKTVYVVLVTYDSNGVRLSRVVHPEPIRYQVVQASAILALPDARFAVIGSGEYYAGSDPTSLPFKRDFGPSSFGHSTIGAGNMYMAATGLGGEEYYAGNHVVFVNNVLYVPLHARIWGYVEPSPSNPGMKWTQAVWGAGEAFAFDFGRDANGDLVLVGMASAVSGDRGFIARYACPPVARDDRYTVSGPSLSVSAPGVRVNDVQATNATLTVTQQPTNGTITLANDGSLTYVPNAGFSGEDSASYILTRGPYSSVGEIVFAVP